MSVWPSDDEGRMSKSRQEDFGPPWAAETTGFENPGEFPLGDISNKWRRHQGLPAVLTDEEIGAVFGHVWPETREAQLIEIDFQVRSCMWSLIGPNWKRDWAKSWKEPFLDQLSEAQRLERSKVQKLGLCMEQEKKRLREADENYRQTRAKAKHDMNQELDDMIQTGSDRIEQCSQAKATWL